MRRALLALTLACVAPAAHAQKGIAWMHEQKCMFFDFVAPRLVYARETGKPVSWARAQMDAIFRQPNMMPGVAPEAYQMVSDIWTHRDLDSGIIVRLAHSWCGWDHTALEDTMTPQGEP